MLYPLRFDPVFKPYIWGGRSLERYGKDLPEGIVAESWELAAHKDGSSTVANGIYQGKTIPELMEILQDQLVGASIPKWAKHQFPLLVKFIDANDNLSVQVHPDDSFARQHENGSLGKNEMWLILEAKPGAKLIMDVKPGTTRENFTQAIQKDLVLDCLREVEVKAGDTFYIPAGRIHAIGKGIILIEIQQNSNTTYRVYDYGRVNAQGIGRELHQDKALQVIDFRGTSHAAPKTWSEELKSGIKRSILVASSFFIVERHDVKGRLMAEAKGDRFFTYSILSGNCLLSSNDEELSLKKGDTILIPASLGAYSFSGTYSAVLSYLPDEKIGTKEALENPVNIAMEAALKENAAGIKG